MFEWKVFFSCVVGFFALAADPRVFALRRVGNLGLWIFTLAAIQQPTLTVFIGDHRQTPGGLSKGRAAAVNRRKLLQRPLGLRALDKSGDYLPPARMAALIAQLWPDASQDPESDLFSLLRLANKSHSGP